MLGLIDANCSGAYLDRVPGGRDGLPVVQHQRGGGGPGEPRLVVPRPSARPILHVSRHNILFKQPDAAQGISTEKPTSDVLIEQQSLSRE